MYAVFKLWTSVISPFVLGRSSAPTLDADADTGRSANGNGTTTSKRQEKLRKRQEKGDPRVRAVQSSAKK